MENVITIKVKDNTIAFNSEKPTTYPEISQILFSTMLCFMNQVVEQTPEEHVAAVKEDMYDQFNFAASSILSMFAPEIEMRPNLTVDAIMKAENDIITSYENPEELLEHYGIEENSQDISAASEGNEEA